LISTGDFVVPQEHNVDSVLSIEIARDFFGGKEAFVDVVGRLLPRTNFSLWEVAALQNCIVSERLVFRVVAELVGTEVKGRQPILISLLFVETRLQLKERVCITSCVSLSTHLLSIIELRIHVNSADNHKSGLVKFHYSLEVN
jgi:hypothetical protein